MDPTQNSMPTMNLPNPAGLQVAQNTQQTPAGVDPLSIVGLPNPAASTPQDKAPLKVESIQISDADLVHQVDGAIEQYSDDPFEESDALSKLKAEYLKNEHGVHLNVSDSASN